MEKEITIKNSDLSVDINNAVGMIMTIIFTITYFLALGFLKHATFGLWVITLPAASAVVTFLYCRVYPGSTFKSWEDALLVWSITSIVIDVSMAVPSGLFSWIMAGALSAAVNFGHYRLSAPVKGISRVAPMYDS